MGFPKKEHMDAKFDKRGISEGDLLKVRTNRTPQTQIGQGMESRSTHGFPVATRNSFACPGSAGCSVSRDFYYLATPIVCMPSGSLWLFPTWKFVPAWYLTMILLPYHTLYAPKHILSFETYSQEDS